MALDALVESFNECLEGRSTGVGPQRQFEHVHTAATGLAPAYGVLADLHALGQFGLAQAGIGPEGVELLKEQLVLLTVERVSHPVPAAGATGQDQS